MYYVEVKTDGWAIYTPILQQLRSRLAKFARKHGDNQLSDCSYLTLRNGWFSYVALAYHNKKLVGFSAKEEYKFSVTVVHKQHRRQGIGRKLMKLKKPLESWVDRGNLPMRMLCESVGMQVHPLNLGFPNDTILYRS